jgi:hypothetical protein
MYLEIPCCEREIGLINRRKKNQLEGYVIEGFD